MSWFRFVLILGWLTLATSHEKAPFRDGIEYRYDWEAGISTESMESDHLASSTRLRGQLHVVSKSETSGWRTVFRLKNVTLAMQLGSKISQSSPKYTDVVDLSNELNKPFELFYTQAKIVGATFSKKEPVWSTNFKRSIASLFQIHLVDGESVYNNQELTLFGKCHVNYYATKSGNEIQLQKESDFDSCDGKYGRWRTFIQPTECPAASQNQKIASSTGTSFYTVTPNRGFMEIVSIRSSGTILLDPFGISQSAMVSKTNIAFNLEKTKRSSGSTESNLDNMSEYEDNLSFVFGHSYDRVDPTTVDLKAAQNLMLHPESFISSHENLRRKSLVDIFSALETIGADSSDQKINLDTVALSSISYQLGSLDYNNLRALYRELTIASGNEKLHSAKNVFLDLLLHSGSNAGIILLRDLIQEAKLDEYLAARLVSYVGVYVKQPSEKLLLEFQSVLDSRLPSYKSQIFRNAAILSYANLAAKTCAPGSNFGVPCAPERLSHWQRTFFDMLTTSTTFADRALYTHALRNIGYGTVLEQMMELVESDVGNAEENGQSLRVYIVQGFNRYKDDPKVFNLLINLLRNDRENFQVRIAAVGVLLNNPTTSILSHIRHLLKTNLRHELRQFITTSLDTIVKSRSPCLQNVKGLAQEILYSTNNQFNSVRYSAAYTYDFFEGSSSFGSQLNMRVTSGEYDDLPSFVDGKFVYFLKGFAYEPFSFTVRMTNMRKYLMSVMSSSLRSEDLNLSRLQQLVEGFQFMARKDKGISVDISFNLHGNTIMFYSLDPSFFRSAIFSFSSLESMQDAVLNFQRYATTGALLYTQPNALGLPTSFVFSAPLLISLKGAITKPKSSASFHRNVNVNLYGEIYADNGILFHFTPLSVTQGVIRNRKAFFNMPFNAEVAVDLKKMQLDFNYGVPTASRPMEISSFARTILTLKGSESSDALVKLLCPQCYPMVVVRDATPLKTENLANLTWPFIGMEAHLQQFNCGSTQSVGDTMALVLNALNPSAMNYNELVTGWAFLSFLRLQHHFLIQPNGGHCGVRGRIFQTKVYPVKEIAIRLKLKVNLNEEPEVAWQTGKFALKAEMHFKGESSGTDRKGEVDVNYEYKAAGARNNLNFRIVLNRIPFMGYKDWMVCIKSESIFQPVIGDMIDIYGHDQPPSAQGNVEFVLGETSQPNQCPTDQFRFKINLKASAGNWVLERRDKAQHWPYRECRAEINSSNWVSGIVPQTEACYRSALDFTSLTNYHMDLRGAAVPHQVSKLLGKAGDAFGLFFFPYATGEKQDGLSNNTKDFGHLVVNISYLPVQDQNRKLVDIVTVVNDAVERYSQVPLPSFLQVPLPSTSIPQSSRIAYETKSIPTCLVTSQYIQSLDNVTWSNSFSPCYSLISSDCGSNPSYAVFARKTNGLYPLAVRVNVGGHNIEIIPDESGRRKQFSVRANDMEVDVTDKSSTLPEGREKFYVLKIRYQSPIYIISSPGAGLLVHYSGSHITVFPAWIHKNQHCGLCGNFDGEKDKEWVSPQGCTLADSTQFMASYTMGRVCFPDKPVCPSS